MARVAIISLERDESKGLNERDDATDFIDKILLIKFSDKIATNGLVHMNGMMRLQMWKRGWFL